MVAITNFEEFLSKSKQLFLARPSRTRYSMKYRHVDSNLVLKVTDDVVVLRFVTSFASDLRHVERLTAMFLRLMSSKKAVLDQEPLEEEELVKEEEKKTPAPKKGKGGAHGKKAAQ